MISQLIHGLDFHLQLGIGNLMDFDKKKNVTEEDRKLALETYLGITASDTGARLALFKRLRSDLKQYLTI